MTGTDWTFIAFLIVMLTFLFAMTVTVSVLHLKVVRELSGGQSEEDVNRIVANVIRMELDRRGVPDRSTDN